MLTNGAGRREGTKMKNSPAVFRWLLSLLVILSTASLVSKAAASETAEGMKKDFTEFKEQMSHQLDIADQKLQELATHVKSSSDQAGQKTVKELEKIRSDLKAGLDHLSGQGSKNWKKVKNNFADAIDQLNAKIQKASRN